LLETIKNDDRFVVLLNDYEPYVLESYRSSLNIVNAGVCEQNLVNLAAGISKSNKKSIVIGISPFLILRAYEQIKVNVVCMSLPVTIIGVGQGTSFSFDGPTHHCTDDVSLMKNLECSIYNPCNSSTSFKCCSDILSSNTFNYVCLGKDCSYEFETDDDYCFLGVTENGVNNSGPVEGLDLLVVTTGGMLNRVVDAIRAENLCKRVGVLFVLRSHKFPKFHIPKTRILVVQETLNRADMSEEIGCEHNIDRLSYQSSNIREYGSVEFIRSSCGLDRASIQRKVKKLACEQS
jgi:transketolase